MPRHLLPTLAAGAALAACGLGAPPAHADSIAYVKGGDAWLATPDGSRRQQVTHTGDVAYVSQADDGTLMALVGGERLRKLSPTGRTLAEFPTFVSDGSPQAGPVNQFGGPFEPEISRDGRLVAFEWFNQRYDDGTSSDCSAAGSPPCYVLTSRQGVGITRSDAFTGFEEFGLLTGWIGPRWVGGDKLLRSDSGAVMNEDTVFNTIGPGKADDDMDRWFWDENGGLGLREVELTRDRRALAGVAGASDQFLRVYRPLVEPFGAPDQDLGPFAHRDQLVEPCFQLSGDAGERFETPSFSPDGRTLAYGVQEGIYTVDVPDFSGGCRPATANTLLIPGGRFPHWGPADVPPASAYEQAAAGQDVAQPGPGAATVRVAGARVARRTLLRGRATLAATVSGAGTVTARGGGLATTRRRASRAGRVRVALRLTRAGTARVKGGRTRKLAVTVAFAPAGGGAPVVGRATVRVR